MVMQTYNRWGDPINFHAQHMGRSKFFDKFQKHSPNCNPEIINEFWSDFYHTRNQTFNDYLKEIQS